VAGRVGDDERPPGRREEAVRDVDGDALLALGPQPVGDRGQVAAAGLAAAALERVELVGEDQLGVEEQAPDERALAVVDRARRRDAQQVAAGGGGGGRAQK
jgi:hypothetical protein